MLLCDSFCHLREKWNHMRSNLLRRIGAALVGGGLVAGMMVTGASTASADAITPFNTPKGINMGQITLATAPGGVLDVHITGRTDALTSAGQVSFGCLVYVNDRSQFIELDVTGSGSTRFEGLTNREYGVYGKCAHRDISAVTERLGAPDSTEPSGLKGYTNVTIDGNPTSQTAGGLSAAGTPQANCAQTVDALFNELPPGAEAVAGLIKPVTKFVQPVFMGICGAWSLITSPNILADQNLFDSICLGLESAMDPLGLGIANDFFCGTPVS